MWVTENEEMQLYIQDAYCGPKWCIYRKTITPEIHKEDIWNGPDGVLIWVGAPHLIYL